MVATRASASIDAASERFAARLNADLAAAARPYPAPRSSFLGPSANAPATWATLLCFLFGDTIRALHRRTLANCTAVARAMDRRRPRATPVWIAVELRPAQRTVRTRRADATELETINAHH
ncbi:MAG: hypothetical protein MZV65_40485 [Chromatiales bacterium]|nr:hypothetical protein [Chromatiales bacterium]